MNCLEQIVHAYMRMSIFATENTNQEGAQKDIKKEKKHQNILHLLDQIILFPKSNPIIPSYFPLSFPPFSQIALTTHDPQAIPFSFYLYKKITQQLPLLKTKQGVRQKNQNRYQSANQFPSIIMQINLNTSQQSFPLLSPIFQHTPMLSPLPEDTLRKYSYNYDDFASFRLEPCEDQNYLLFEIQELPQEHMHVETHLSEEKPSNLKKELPLPKIAEQTPSKHPHSPSQNKSDLDLENDPNSDSEKQELSFHPLSDRVYSPLEKLIHFLILNLNKDENQIKRQVLKGFEDETTFGEIVSILLKKFKKSKKTKEEMVKYCMRKAFKFIADKMKKDRAHNRDIDSCLRIYFSKNQSNPSFSIPFKKNSIQKTMNGSFLKRIFTSQNFLDDYKEFLHEFEELIEQDNYRKIKYLAEMIETYLKTGQQKKIQTIKRLPWTQEMLDQTLQLSKTLVEYAEWEAPTKVPGFRKRGGESPLNGLK